MSALIAPRVREMLIAERAAATPRKQLLTAARIGRLLLAEGLVAASTLRSVVRQARLDVRDPLRHAFVPLVYAPGEDAQVDFFEGEVDDVKLGRVKCFVLLVRACYSGRTFAYAAPNQTREALFEGLMRAFEFFGGVFKDAQEESGLGVQAAARPGIFNPYDREGVAQLRRAATCAAGLQGPVVDDQRVRPQAVRNKTPSRSHRDRRATPHGSKGSALHPSPAHAANETRLRPLCFDT
ncbi:MAG: hypothetical protein IPH13_21795 [Planctomycetes bacterium]|nr:hypothetical protein [Planctomycetota bacterium]